MSFGEFGADLPKLFDFSTTPAVALGTAPDTRRTFPGFPCPAVAPVLYMRWRYEIDLLNGLQIFNLGGIR
jgi:hypothetical protein